MDTVEVTVEFFGIPRQRAGRAELTVQARTIVDLLSAVEQACPGLEGLVRSDGRMAPQYLLSVDGREFGTNLQRRLKPGERVLLLSADAGG
ncbi:MAG TPA: MoaD/ThiS family protein [Gemmataceae bacterium]|nr:MoaD/ThiS family protein [Gemmataceae bacterium]